MHTLPLASILFVVISNIINPGRYVYDLLFCRGGKICLTDHFKPLWARNVPKFGIAHAMALGVSRH